MNAEVFVEITDRSGRVLNYWEPKDEKQAQEWIQMGYDINGPMKDERKHLGFKMVNKQVAIDETARQEFLLI